MERELAHFRWGEDFRVDCRWSAEKYPENHLPGKTMQICREKRVFQVLTSAERRMLFPISQRTCVADIQNKYQVSFSAGSLQGLNLNLNSLR